MKNINYLLSKQQVEPVLTENELFMTYTEELEGVHIAQYLGPVHVTKMGTPADGEVCIELLRYALSAKAKKMGATAIVGLHYEISQTSSVSEKSIDDSFTSYSHCLYLAYGMAVIAHFDKNRPEYSLFQEKSNKKKSYLTNKEFNDYRARKLIIEGLKGQGPLDESSLWKLLCEYPSKEYSGMIIDYVTNKYATREELDYASRRGFYLWTYLEQYLSCLCLIDKEEAKDIAFSLPAYHYCNPVTVDGGEMSHILCHLGLFDARRIVGMLNKGDINSAFGIVKVYTDSGFVCKQYGDEDVESFCQLSEKLSSIITPKAVELQSEIARLEDEEKRKSKAFDSQINEKKKYHTYAEEQEFAKEMSRIRREKSDNCKKLKPYESYKTILKEFDAQVTMLRDAYQEMIEQQ